MSRRILWEAIACAVIGLALLIYTGSGMLAARTAVRDNLRKEDITHLKRALEAYYNRHEFYIAPPQGHSNCTQSNEEDSWFFTTSSPLLTEQYIDALPHDVRESKDHVYIYCAININGEKALGYTLQAMMEIDQKDTCSFDEDEARKFEFQISHERNAVLYTVFGGNAPTCHVEEE